MTTANRWLLPDGVDEILPPKARRLEMLRRDILDLYQTWGYELVVTPLVEFLDSLLIVPSSKLKLRTFTIMDQLSGRSMGVRADITSQVARIDAHVLKQNGPTRLCYVDSVLHTTPSTLLGSRSPIRIGAELYGHSGVDSDLEVIGLMLETLKTAGITDPTLALGHVGIYRGLIDQAGLEQDLERNVFRALQSKSTGEIESLLFAAGINGPLRSMLIALSTLHGDIRVFDEAEQALAAAPDATRKAISEMHEAAQRLQIRYPEQPLYFDLAELRGYEYHTGLVFACYRDGYGEALSKGGRYDHIGEVFGRARPATGFDTDLKTLLSFSKQDRQVPPVKIFAPAGEEPALNATIDTLRATGHIVIRELAGQQQDPRDMGCSRVLVRLQDGQWQVQDLQRSQ